MSVKTPIVIEDQNSVSNTIKNEEFKDFKGKYLKASLPVNWSIKEYYDNTGMDELRSDSEYEGLTGFEVLENNKVVIKFSGVDGIGGINACNVVYKFEDTEASYVQNYIDFAKEQNFPVPTVEDLSSKEYSEYEVFGLKVRRIGSDMYWGVSTDGYFNPFCGLSKEIINLKTNVFKVSSEKEFTSSTFNIQLINKSLKETDYIEMDKILESVSF